MKNFTRLGFAATLLLATGMSMAADDFVTPRARLLHADDIWEKNAHQLIVIWDYQSIYDGRFTKNAGNRTMTITKPDGTTVTKTNLGYTSETPSIEGSTAGGTKPVLNNGLVWTNFGLWDNNLEYYQEGLYLATIADQAARFWLGVDPYQELPDPATAPDDAPWSQEVVMGFRTLNTNFSFVQGEQLVTKFAPGATDLKVQVQYPEGSVLSGVTLFADLLNNPVEPPKEQVPGQETYDDPDYFENSITIQPSAFSFENGVLTINLEDYINPALKDVYYIVLPNYQVQVEKNKVYSGTQVLKVVVGDVYGATPDPESYSDFYVTEDNEINFTYEDAEEMAVATPDVVLQAENTKTGVATQVSYTIEENVLTVDLNEVALGNYKLVIPAGFLTINTTSENVEEIYYFSVVRTLVENEEPVYSSEDFSLSITWPTESSLSIPNIATQILQLTTGKGDAIDIPMTNVQIYGNTLKLKFSGMGLQQSDTYYIVTIPQGYINMGDDYQNAAVTVMFNQNGVTGVESLAGENGMFTIYNTLGVKVMNTADKSQISTLPSGLYIINGKKVVIR